MSSKVSLSEFDIQIISFISKFGYCQERHIQQLCSLSNSETNKIIKHLIKQDYLIKNNIITTHPPYLLLTKKSANFLDIKISSKIVLNTLLHDTLLVDLYFYLQLKYPDTTIYSDKQLKREFGAKQFKNNLRIPDLLIGDHLAIELEITEKSKDRLQNIVNSYITNENILHINYYLKSKSLASKIYALTNQSPKFRFFILKQDKDFNLEIEIFNNQSLPSINNKNPELIGIVRDNSTPKTFGGYTF